MLSLRHSPVMLERKDNIYGLLLFCDVIIIRLHGFRLLQHAVEIKPAHVDTEQVITSAERDGPNSIKQNKQM